MDTEAGCLQPTSIEIINIGQIRFLLLYWLKKRTAQKQELLLFVLKHPIMTIMWTMIAPKMLYNIQNNMWFVWVHLKINMTYVGM